MHVLTNTYGDVCPIADGVIPISGGISGRICPIYGDVCPIADGVIPIYGGDLSIYGGMSGRFCPIHSEVSPIADEVLPISGGIQLISDEIYTYLEELKST